MHSAGEEKIRAIYRERLIKILCTIASKRALISIKFRADGINYRKEEEEKKSQNLRCVIKMRFKIHYFQLVPPSCIIHSTCLVFSSQPRGLALTN